MRAVKREKLCELRWQRMRRPPTEAADPTGMIRFVDLFSGCGGLSLGVLEACRKRRIAAKIALAVDSNDDAIRVYRRNLGAHCAAVNCARVESLFGGALSAPVSEKERLLAAAIGPIDLLVAGPPCQGHSDLNNHSRRRDRRNALYARVARAAHVLSPTVVIIENVVGVVNDRGRVVSRAERLLRSGGYVVESICVDASHIGVPQQRRRHFLIAFRNAKEIGWIDLPLYKGPSLTVGDVLRGLEDEPESSVSLFTTASRCQDQNLKRIEFLFKDNSYELPDSMRPPCHRDGDHSYKAVYGRLRWDGIANTLTSGFGSMGQGRYVHPTRPRLITPHEAARLMGFPDWFSFQDVTARGSLQTLIGNAVIPKMAAWLVDHLLTTGLLTPRLVASAPTNQRRAPTSSLVNSNI